jgi:hypothetical protein
MLLHTNEPWTVIKKNGLFEVRTQGKLIAEVKSGNEYDAYLISAAPDLLSVCMDALTTIRDNIAFCQDIGRDRAQNEMRSVIGQLKEVIQKSRA